MPPQDSSTKVRCRTKRVADDQADDQQDDDGEDRQHHDVHRA